MSDQYLIMQKYCMLNMQLRKTIVSYHTFLTLDSLTNVDFSLLCNDSSSDCSVLRIFVPVFLLDRIALYFSNCNKKIRNYYYH